MFDDTEDPCGLPEEYRQIRPSRTPRQLVRRLRQRVTFLAVPNQYMYGYNPWKWLTLVELEQRSTWHNLDSEFKRRLLALFDASGQRVGIGGGWRSSEQQEALFRSRYTPFNSPPGTFWNGQYWRLKPGMSPSTPPGRSYHEDTTPDGAVAGDLIGDLDLAHDLGPARGLRDLGNLSPTFDEPWHFQPSEVPTARINYSGGPLATWPLPGSPLPPLPPPPEEIDMASDYKALVRVSNDQKRVTALVLASSDNVQMFGIPDADISKVAAKAGVSPTPDNITAQLYDDFQMRALRAAGFRPATETTFTAANGKMWTGLPG